MSLPQPSASDGIGTEGVDLGLDRTTAAWLFYDRAGRCLAFLDPGGGVSAGLTDRQLRVVRQASWLCLTAGPPEATSAALREVGPGVRIGWVVKADRACFPATLVRELCRRCSVVVYNRAEEEFLLASVRLDIEDAVGDDCLLVRTDGVEPVRYRAGRQWRQHAVVPVRVPDATGAGDAFAGSLMASLSCGVAEPGAAVANAVRAARGFLLRPE